MNKKLFRTVFTLFLSLFLFGTSVNPAVIAETIDNAGETIKGMNENEESTEDAGKVISPEDEKKESDDSNQENAGDEEKKDETLASVETQPAVAGTETASVTESQNTDAETQTPAVQPVAVTPAGAVLSEGTTTPEEKPVEDPEENKAEENALGESADGNLLGAGNEGEDTQNDTLLEDANDENDAKYVKLKAKNSLSTGMTVEIVSGSKVLDGEEADLSGHPGSTANLKAEKKDGYMFDGWYQAITDEAGNITGYDKNEKLSAELSYSFTLQKDTYIYCLYREIKSTNVVITDDSNITDVVINNSSRTSAEISEGEHVTIFVVPEGGYFPKIQSVMVDGETWDDDNYEAADNVSDGTLLITYLQPAKAVTITINVEKGITVYADANGGTKGRLWNDIVEYLPIDEENTLPIPAPEELDEEFVKAPENHKYDGFEVTDADGSHTVAPGKIHNAKCTKDITVKILWKNTKKEEPAKKEESSSTNKPVAPVDTVVTCQMAGYPSNYNWNEAAKACQPGYLDAGGVFPPYNIAPARKSAVIPNTSDYGSLTVYAWLTMLSVTVALYAGVKLLHEDWKV